MTGHPPPALYTVLLALEEQRIRALQASSAVEWEPLNAKWGRVADLQAAYRRRHLWRAQL